MKIKDNVPAPNLDACYGHIPEERFTGLMEEEDLAVGANNFEEVKDQ